ncbi:MAG: o-succinylbenzoate synthase [Pyrinomonadaceae bacterium]
MIIRSVELREIRLPLVHFFETSFGRTTERRIVLARVESDDGGEGWGECTAGEGPFYSDEWTDSAWLSLEKFLAPLIVNVELGSAGDVFAVFRHVRGHRMAKAAIETACWDLEAKLRGLPLWKLLGGTQTEISCGVSIGIQDSVAILLEKIQKEVDAGYQRIKIKIKPGWDAEVISIVRQQFPDIGLVGDANSAYTLAATPLFQNLDRFHLMMFEQPLAHDDIFDHGELQRQIKTPICLDESIHSAEDARNAINLGACRIVNLKLGRVGGHSEAQRVESVCRQRGVPVWCGGMLESGIGRAHNIAMSTLAGFTLPGDVSASERYWARDIIEPAVTVSPRGTIQVPTEPGLGFAVDLERVESLTVRRATIKSNTSAAA